MKRIASLEARNASLEQQLLMRAAPSPVRYDRMRRSNSFLMWMRGPWAADLGVGPGRSRSISNLSDLGSGDSAGLSFERDERQLSAESDGDDRFDPSARRESVSLMGADDETGDVPRFVLNDENAVRYARKTLVRAFRMKAGQSSRGGGDWMVTSPLRERASVTLSVSSDGDVLHDVEIVPHVDFARRFAPARGRDSRAGEYRQVTTVLAKLMDAPFSVRLSQGGQEQTPHDVAALSLYAHPPSTSLPERASALPTLPTTLESAEEDDRLGPGVERVARASWTTVGTAGEYLVQEHNAGGRVSQYVVSQADFDDVFVVTAESGGEVRAATSPRLAHASAAARAEQAAARARAVEAGRGGGADGGSAAAGASAAERGGAWTAVASANPPPSPQLAELLANITSWSFSAFELRRLSGGRPLYALVSHLVSRHALGDALQCEPRAFDGFIRKCCGNHLENPYHNAMHVSDVVQAVHYLTISSGLWGRLKAIERLVVVVAAAVHDLAHPGTSGRFQVQTGSALALLYNDKSVLENFHIASAFGTSSLIRRLKACFDPTACLHRDACTGMPSVHEASSALSESSSSAFFPLRVPRAMPFHSRSRCALLTPMALLRSHPPLILPAPLRRSDCCRV
jgi:hypothetical protein